MAISGRISKGDYIQKYPSPYRIRETVIRIKGGFCLGHMGQIASTSTSR